MTQMDTDQLFTRAITSTREVFWAEHSHLPEPERQRLWGQYLARFMTTPTADAPAATCDEDDGGVSLSFGKRSRPQVLPSTSSSLPVEIPPAKRRVTVGVPTLAPPPLFSASGPGLTPGFIGSGISRGRSPSRCVPRFLSVDRPDEFQFPFSIEPSGHD